MYDHDLGFLFFCSYGKGYEATGDEAYRTVILQAADSLATLFNPTVGTLLAWPLHVKDFGGHNTIMDTMMNLEMLFWAARHGGDPALRDIAVRHAETTMRHHFRPDATCYHVAVYDTVTGDFLRGCTHQGYSDSSVWARGQAWAVYGYTACYRYTGDKRYLDHARKVAGFMLDDKNMPADLVPYWDYDAPNIPNEPRDVSTAAIIASAFYEMYTYTGDGLYKQKADRIVESLSSPAYRAPVGGNGGFLLMHSVGSIPHGSNIDVPLNYADYYFLEALIRKGRLEAGEPLF